MPFVAAPNQVQVEMRGILGGERVENRIFVNCFHEPVIADLNAIADAVGAAIGLNWISLMPTTWRLNELFLRSMHAENAIQATYPQPSGSFTGTSAFQQLPNNVTICVSLRSNFSGRSARGRFYWQALTESLVDGNLLTTAAQSSIVSAVQALNVNIGSIGFDWQIVSFIHNGAPRPAGPVYFPVNSILLVDAVVDSQRRRLPGRGN